MLQDQVASKGVGLLESGNYYDSELYDGGSKNSKYEGYVTSIAPNDDADEDDDVGMPVQNNGQSAPKRVFNAAAQAMKEMVQVSLLVTSDDGVDTKICFIFQSEPDFDPFAEHRRPTVGEKEDEYRQKRRRLVISPDRVDPFADGRCCMLANH